jgi:diguanylate cyclase (GGDEF)-like protein/PAS domain S-box-containing protein
MARICIYVGIATAIFLCSCWLLQSLDTRFAGVQVGISLGVLLLYGAICFALIAVTIDRARLFAAMAESEARYRSVIEALSEGVILQDAAGHVLAWNVSAERIFRVTGEWLKAHSPAELPCEALHEDGTPFLRESFPGRTTIRTGTPQIGVVMGLRYSDGVVTWVLLNTQPLMRPGEERPYAVVTSFADITRQKELEEALRQQAMHDMLTGLFNRRYLEVALDKELQRATRGGTAVGLMMVDIDHFKQINDTYGHLIGDEVLQAIGAFLRERIRGEDIVCRYGGEEFTLMLPNASIDETRRRAEELREAIKTLPLRVGTHALPPISLSIGIAVFPSHGTNGDALLRVADAALYQAKLGGRDRVVVGVHPAVQAEARGH